MSNSSSEMNCTYSNDSFKPFYDTDDIASTISNLSLHDAFIDTLEDTEGNIQVVVNNFFKYKPVNTECPPWYDHHVNSYTPRHPVRKTLKRDNRLIKSNNLPIIAVSKNFTKDIQDCDVGVALLSEVWEKSQKKNISLKLRKCLKWKD